MNRLNSEIPDASHIDHLILPAASVPTTEKNPVLETMAL
jgi:hypothetical protein